MSEGPIPTADGPRPAFWLDDGPLVGEWAPPGGAAPTPRPVRIRPAVLYGVIALALVLVAVSIWGLGGLGKRTDTLRATAPGELITTGPYELAFTEVTAQRKTDYDKSVYWKVTALGSGRTTGSSTIAPDAIGNDAMFISKDVRSQEFQLPTSADFGGTESQAADFVPGLAPVPYAVEFRYSEGYQPGQTLTMLVFDLDFYDNSLLHDGEKAWHNSEYSHRLDLPVRVLPEDTY